MKRRKKAHEAPGAEDEAENDTSDNEVGGGGRACRQKGWWKRGDVEAKLNTVNMTAWVHKECDIIEEEALTSLLNFKKHGTAQNRRMNVPCAWMTLSEPTGWALRSACWADMAFRE